jgi:hypothetical protein
MQLYDKAKTDELLSGKLSDAPSDGTTYGRKDGAWIAAGGGAQSVNTITTGSHTFTSTDANNIVYIPAGYYTTLYVPQDSTYSFAVGTVITLCVNGSSMTSTYIVPEDTMTPAPVLLGTTTITSTKTIRLIKVAANTWILD